MPTEHEVPLPPHLASLQATGDYVILKTEDYARYAAILANAMAALRAWYAAGKAGGMPEDIQATLPLVKLLGRSLALLLYRSTYTLTHSLPFDLNGSGFPNIMAMHQLASDYHSAPAAIEGTETRANIRERILHEIFYRHRVPTELVAMHARRDYTRQLTEGPVLLPFSLGDLVEGKILPNGRRECQLTWASYDSESNLPHFYFMKFEWSGSQDLSADKVRREALTELLQSHCARATAIGLLAQFLDEGEPRLHPKLVVRNRVGPLLTAGFSREKSSLVDALKRSGDEGGFVLEVLVEGVISQGEEAAPSAEPAVGLRRLIGSLASRWVADPPVRQKFFHDMEDPEANRALASYVSRRVLMPHALRQAIPPGDPLLRAYSSQQIVTYDGAGVHVA